MTNKLPKAEAGYKGFRTARAELIKFHPHIDHLSKEEINAITDISPANWSALDEQAIVALEELRETFIGLSDVDMALFARRVDAEIGDDAINHTGLLSPEEIEQAWNRRHFNYRFVFSFLSEEQNKGPSVSMREVKVTKQ